MSIELLDQPKNLEEEKENPPAPRQHRNRFNLEMVCKIVFQEIAVCKMLLRGRRWEDFLGLRRRR